MKTGNYRHRYQSLTFQIGTRQCVDAISVGISKVVVTKSGQNVVELYNLVVTMFVYKLPARIAEDLFFKERVDRVSQRLIRISLFEE